MVYKGGETLSLLLLLHSGFILQPTPLHHLTSDSPSLAQFQFISSGTMRFPTALFPLFTLASCAVLTFDDLPVPNDPNCGSLTFTPATPYKGFTISGTVLNTTQTQYCHQSSSGAGPWHRAVSQPNLLTSMDGVVAFEAKKKFDVSQLAWATELHWTILAMDPNAVVRVMVQGMKMIGGPPVVTKSIDVQAPGPHVIELPGFKGFKAVSVKAELRYTKQGALVVLGAPSYVDNFIYKFL